MPIRVLDKTTGETRAVSAQEAELGVASGKFKFADPKVQVRKGLETGDVDVGNFSRARLEGWELINPEDVQQIRIQREESDLPSKARAAAESAASGFTLGLSDIAMREMGVDTERMRARHEAIGELDTIAEIGGAIAPALLTGGATLGGTGARLGAKGLARGGVVMPLVESAGAAVERAVGGKFLGSMARGGVEGFAGGVGFGIHESVLGDRELTAERIGASGLTGALLGGAVGAAIPGLADAASGLVSLPEAGLRKVLAGAVDGTEEGVGVVAKAMGGFSGKGRAETAQGLLNRLKTKGSRDKLHRVVTDRDGEIVRAGHAVQAAADDINDALTVGLRESEGDMRKAFVASKLTPEHDLAIGRMRRAVDEELAAAVEAESSAIRFARPEQADMARKVAGELRMARDAIETGKAADAFMGLQGAVRGIQQRGRAVRVVGDATMGAKVHADEVAGKLQRILGDRDLFGEAADMYTDLIQKDARVFDIGRGQFGKDGMGKTQLGRILSRKQPTDPGDAIAFAKRVSKPQHARGQEVADEYFQAQLESLRARAKHFGSPEAKAALTKAEKAHERYLEAMRDAAETADIDEALKAMGRGGTLTGVMSALGPSGATITGSLLGGPIGAVVGATVSALARPQQTIKTLAVLAHMADEAGFAIDGAVGAMSGKIRGGRGSWKPSKPGRLRHLASRAAGIGAPAIRDERSKRLADRAADLAANPTLLAETISPAMHEINTDAPGLGDAILSHTQRAAAYLASQRPAVYEAPFSGAEPMVDPVDQARYLDCVQATVDPIGTLELMPSGALSMAHAEALRVVWPKIYHGVQQAVMSEAVQALHDSKAVPSDVRSQIGILFDVPSDVGLQPGMIGELARIHGVTQPPPEPPGAGGGKRARKLSVTAMNKLSGKMQTQVQRLSAGGE